MEKISKRDVLKGIGGTAALSLSASSVSAEDHGGGSPSPEYEMEDLSYYKTIDYLDSSVSTRSFQSMYEFLFERDLQLDFYSTDGYAVTTSVNEHILLKIPYMSSSGYCSVRIYKDQTFVRAMISDDGKSEVFISNPNVISEMKEDVVSMERMKEIRNTSEVASGDFTAMSGDCSVVDLAELCPYLTVFGAAGTVTCYFVNSGAGVVATIALADFLAAGCTASAIVEDWDGDTCNHENIKVCADYACSEFAGVVTCNPLPDIYITPVC